MRLRKKKQKNEKAPVPAKPTPSQGTKPEEARTGAPVGPRPKPGGRLINIGKSIRIKGELSGNEDITVDGTVEGKIELKGHNLTIGPNGRITADVFAKNVQVIGKITGDVTADDRVEVTEGGTVEGDIHAPRVSLADGARFSGKIDMLGTTPARTAAPVQKTTAPARMTTTAPEPPKPTSWQPQETPDIDDFDDERESEEKTVQSVADAPGTTVTERQLATSMKPSADDLSDPADTSRP